jgi:transposase
MMTDEERNAREVPDPEVRVTRKQRQFSAEYKLEILARAEACTQRGELREMLEQEGLHSSYLSRWRRARAAGRLGGTRSQKRGPKPAADRELVDENAALRRENETLRRRLAQAETIIEVQKKLSQLLGLESPAAENETPQ